MGTIDISYLSLGIGLLLLLIPLFYIWKFKTGLLRATVIGTARMIVQLFFIGIYLNYLFLWDNPWINFLWVIVMIFVASQTALARTQLKRKILLLPISAGFLCSVVLCRLVLYRNSTESGKRIQRPVFHPYFRHTDGQHAIQ